MTLEEASVTTVRTRTRTAKSPGDGAEMAHFISKRIDELKDLGKTQMDIARECGYERSNIINMFKNNAAKVPLDKIPVLAKALDVDVRQLMRLALSQYWPDLSKAMLDAFDTSYTDNEKKIIEAVRRYSKNSDPALTREAASALKDIFTV